MSGSINSILSNAASGLAATQAGIAVVSDNVSNANVAGFTAKSLQIAAFQTGNTSQGVRTGVVTRTVDSAVQATVFQAAASVAAATVRSNTLTAISNTQGTVGAGTSLADAVTALQTSFTGLQSDPSNTAEQSAVVQAASTLASTINGTADEITTARNDVQSQIESSVTTLNDTLSTIKSTTASIKSALASGASTADLEDTRDQALQTLSGLLGTTYSEQSNGDVTILGQNGFSIPLDATFSTQATALSPESSYSAGGTSIPGIMMQSPNTSTPAVDVTSKLTGGSMGALITLRDTTLPGYTAQLDTLSAQLANQFSAAGLQLFTDGTGTGTLTAYTGLSSALQVNSAVASDPTLVRDGTPANANTSGAASYTGVIDNVLSTAFSATSTSDSVFNLASSFVSGQASDTAKATSDLTTATSYQTTVSSQFSSSSGVNVDDQMGLMIKLQNSYEANARVVQTAQAMFAELLQAVSATSPY